MISRQVWTFARDILTFGLGIWWGHHEVFVHQGTERPVTLALVGALLGLPLVLAADRRRDESDQPKADR